MTTPDTLQAIPSTIDMFQLGGVFILAMSLIEIIKLLVNKFIVKSNGGINKEILDQISLTNGNHLNHIQEGIDKLDCTTSEGFIKLGEIAQTNNKELVILLTEIKGALNNSRVG